MPRIMILNQRARTATCRKYSRFNAPIFIPPAYIASCIMDSVNRPRELLISDCGRTLVAFVAKIIVRGAHHRPSLLSPLALSYLSLPFDLLNLPIYTYLSISLSLHIYLHHHFDLLLRHDRHYDCITAFNKLLLFLCLFLLLKMFYGFQDL